MTPWEMRAHVAFALAETPQHRGMPPIQQRLLTFVRDWHGLWSAYGNHREGWPRYRALLDAGRRDLIALGAAYVALANTIGLMAALDGWVFSVALADRRSNADPEVRQRVGAAHPVPTSAPAAAPGRDPVFDRPVFIVSPPRSGSTMLFETLARAPGVFTIGDESHQLIEGVPQLSPESRGFESNRLLAADATPAMAETLRRRFYETLRDREGQKPPVGAAVRMLEKTPKNSLRVPFLARAFPEARFVFLYRDPRQVLASMIEAWLSDRFQTYRGLLPGWPLPYWAMLLTPGWQALAGKPLPEIVAAQWQATIEVLLRDLAALPAGRWQAVRYDRFVADPASVVPGLCAALDFAWDAPLGPALPLARHTLTPPSSDKWRKHAAAIEPLLPRLQDTIDRAERLAP
jgi:hypothetical protein